MRWLPCRARDGVLAWMLLTCAFLGLSGAAWVAADEPAGQAAAGEPLHLQIDRLLEATSLGAAAPLADDATFLRRVSLDLTGMIPTVEELRAFMADASPQKRTAAIDRLLASPAFSRHMARTFDVMLMERRDEKHVKALEWRQYLETSFSANKPWNQLVKEILAADGSEERIRPAAAFYFYRDGEPNLLTRDVGRVFFGIDLQCAQCHDHPLVDTYYQADYYGIFAFLGQGFVFTDPEKKVFFAEKAAGDVTFTSVFTKQQDKTKPRLPGGFELFEPQFAPGTEYEVAPDNKEKKRPIPKYSRRAQLAERVGMGNLSAFDRNIANRLWAMLMGKGLVEPLDLHHVDNPPSHPELLELLADQMPLLKYDLRAFIRELAMTRAYQRSLSLADDLTQPAQQAITALPMVQQQLASQKTEADAVAKQVSAEDAARREAESAWKTLQEEQLKQLTELAAAAKAANEAAAKLAEAQKMLQEKQALVTLLTAARDKTQVAAERLANDALLVAAAKVFADRMAEFDKQQTQAEAAVTAAQPAAQTTGENRQRAEMAVATTNAKLTPAQETLTTKRNQLDLLQARLRDLRSQQQQLELQLSIAEQLKLYQDARITLSTTEQARQGTQKRAEELQKAIDDTTKVLPELVVARDTAQRTLLAAQKEVADSQARVTSQQEAVGKVAEAVQAAQAALAKLPEDAALKQAAESVQQRHAQAMTELEAATKQLTERQTAAQKATADHTAAQEKVASMEQKLATSKEAMAAAQTELAAQQKRLAETTTQLSAQREKLETLSTERFFAAPLSALSPEQMAWSVMQATGMVAQQRAAAAAAVEKDLPKEGDAAQIAQQRQVLIEKQVYEKLKGNESTFVRLFGHGAGQPQGDFFATVDQALFFANAGTVQSWLAPGGGNLTDRLQKLEQPTQIAEELYLSVLNRLPSQEEVQDVTGYLAGRPNEKLIALQEMAWALITSAEFRFRY